MRAIAGMGLNDKETMLIKDRYVNLVSSAEIDYGQTTSLYMILTNFITIGGVLLVSFISLGRIIGASKDIISALFWTSWALSILVTIANKSLYIFNIPRKYILNVLILEKYKSEGWQFVGGLSRYKYCRDVHERVELFCTRIERIKMKSLELFANVEASSIDQSHGPAEDKMPEVTIEFNETATSVDVINLAGVLPSDELNMNSHNITEILATGPK